MIPSPYFLDGKIEPEWQVTPLSLAPDLAPNLADRIGGFVITFKCVTIAALTIKGNSLLLNEQAPEIPIARVRLFA